MPPRVTGAVVPNLADELEALGTIQTRNMRAAVNPLHPDFLPMLLEPATACRVYAKRKAWREQAIALAELIERAINTHWRAAGSVHRFAYSWMGRVASPLNDYPVWAHRAARLLLRHAGSVFQHGGEAAPAARAQLEKLTGLSTKKKQDTDAKPEMPVTDAQLLAVLAIREVVLATTALGKAVKCVDEDPYVRLWFKAVDKDRRRMRRAELPADVEDELASEEMGRKLDAAIDRAAIDAFYPMLADITQKRLHAERLLLIADIVGTGGLSGAEARRLLVQAGQADARSAEARAEKARVEAELIQRQEAEALKKAEERKQMGDISRKQTVSDRRRMRVMAFELKTATPKYKMKLLYSQVAADISRELRTHEGTKPKYSATTAQRVLTEKLPATVVDRVATYAADEVAGQSGISLREVCERVATRASGDDLRHSAGQSKGDEITSWCVLYVLNQHPKSPV